MSTIVEHKVLHTHPSELDLRLKQAEEDGWLAVSIAAAWRSQPLNEGMEIYVLLHKQRATR